MKPSINKAAAAVCALLFCLSLFAAAAPTAKDAREKTLKDFISWDKNLKTAQFSFTQTTDFEGTPINSSQGRLYKDGQKLRLDTIENGKVVQSAFTDKNTIKIFDDKNRFIMQMSWEDWGKTQVNKALFDFGNYEALLKTHKVKRFEEKEDCYDVVLEPKVEENGSYELEFLLDKKDKFPLEIIISSEGARTRTKLKDVKKNVKIDEGALQ